MKKTAIVTGCNGGIGYATAEKLINDISASLDEVE